MPLVTWDLHLGWLVLAGLALIALTTLPRVLHARPLSVPIVYLAAGYLLFALVPELDGPRPIDRAFDAMIIEYITEFVVIVSLVGAGLRIERRPGFIEWNSVWRLLGITMIVSVVAVGLAGWWLAGLAIAPAILLAGVLAPTDPVLASEVQVPSPDHDDERDEIRFTLTAEAGLNDGLAFPVIHLALAVTAAGFGASFAGWFARDVVAAIAIGVLVGWLLGRLLNRFGQVTGEFLRNETSEGLFSLGMTLLVYGVAEVVGGYGFLAVFVAALVRGSADAEYRRQSHEFVQQIESVVMAIVLIGFGALLSEGLLDDLTVGGAVVGLLLVLVIRPLFGYAALLGRPLPHGERLAIGFFGIRGMGSLYYLAYATTHGDFGFAIGEVWAITGFAVLVSIVLHGVTASPMMTYFDRRRSGVEPHRPHRQETMT